MVNLGSSESRMTEWMYNTSNSRIINHNIGASPNFASFPSLLFSSQRLSSNLRAFPRKKATCLWFLSAASCAGVRPVLSATIRSSFFPACTNTVHASKFPRIAAQWRGVQPSLS
uniref:Uncharacterized protein n=1 Tax=Opuntia streptacantha TaxID=393608 RepID=A0A7C9AK59_OPUST